MAFEYEIRRLVQGWAVTMGGTGLILETHSTEELAELARREYAAGEREAPHRPEVWIVADTFIAEPGMGGLQIGETEELDVRHFKVVRRLSQEEFNEEMEAYREEHGNYPDM